MEPIGGVEGVVQGAPAPPRQHYRLDGEPRLARPQMMEVDQGAVFVEHRELDVADERAETKPCHARLPVAGTAIASGASADIPSPQRGEGGARPAGARG